MRLSVIIVASGNDELLGECVASVGQALLRVDGQAELIVVLNGRAQARERLHRLAPGLVMVDGAPEHGYAGGVAAGLARAAGEWVALVNDDCTVDADALAELLAAGEHESRVGSVAAQIRFAARPETINSAGIEIDNLGIAYERRLGEPAWNAETGVVEVFGASATFALYRRAMLDSLGGLDETFFAYLEDADLAWRSRMAGWRCVLAPRAIALHVHSATLGHRSSAKHRLVGRNRVRMLAKNASAGQLRRGLIPMVAYDALYIAFAAVTDRTLTPLAGRLQGLGDWRAYRSAGRPGRREVVLSRSPGLRGALRRNRAYRPGTALRLGKEGG
jgi:GT2 family glycosyltransferase